MKKLSKLKSNVTPMEKKINELITQLNEHKEELRLIKSKLRINAHFSKRKA